jgi:HlyD family secretion protein
MATDLDLRQLALDRGLANARRRTRRRAVLSRYVLPGVVLLGFTAMLGWVAGDRLLAAKPVTVVPVMVTRGEVQQSGTPLFQAAGWIEPRPTPVIVSALAEGFLAELLVVEGQEIEAGQPVARLIDADARLALQQARADAALRAAETESAHAELHAARMRLENPVHLEAALFDAQSLLAKTQTEISRIPFLIEASDARVEYARQNLSRKQAVGSAVAKREVQEAQSEFVRATAERNELRERGPCLAREAKALQQRCDALAGQLELLIDENRQAADAAARLKAAQAREHQVELAVQAAQLRLDRMVVKSPIAGRVLSLVARPGWRMMGIDPGAEHKSSTVITLYDPQMLQLRADVRLEDMSLVRPGQPVQIDTASAKEPIAGEVLHATSQANIQKNTLEVKVAILSPPPTIRPEMLATATFLAPERPGARRDDSELQERLLIPRQLVESAGDAATVWIAGADGLAHRKSVRLGKAGTEELVEAFEGLTPTDRLIAGVREGLVDGDRIRITGEDGSIGMMSAVPRSSAHKP